MDWRTVEKIDAYIHIGKCGFYCGACPTYLAGNCLGCVEEHKEGDCYTRDCVLKSWALRSATVRLASERSMDRNTMV